jgi:L-threonylcarbamoyladenylate synthase
MKVIKLEELDGIYLEEVVSVLNGGGLVIYPTETVYGLGADATSESALEKLWEFKGERGDKPVLVAVSSTKMAGEYVDFNDLGKKIVQKYWPGAVAVVAMSRNRVAKKAQGGAETLGLRMIDSKIILKMINLFGKPITSTSANVSSGSTAKSLPEFLKTVPEDRQELIDIFIDGGELPLRQPSTIVDTTGKEAKILRQGEVVIET